MADGRNGRLPEQDTAERPRNGRLQRDGCRVEHAGALQGSAARKPEVWDKVRREHRRRSLMYTHTVQQHGELFVVYCQFPELLLSELSQA